jgi:hypothetical protein
VAALKNDEENVYKAFEQNPDIVVLVADQVQYFY